MPWILPALSATVLLFLGGILVAAAQSFGLLSLYGPSVPTLQHYSSLIQSREFQTSLCHLSSFGLVHLDRRSRSLVDLRRHPRHHRALAYPAVALADSHSRSARRDGCCRYPVDRAIRIDCPRSPLLGLIATSAEFPVLINDRFGSGIIIVYVLKELPFLAVMCVTVLLRTGDEY